jgi:hypothetical protein
MCPELGVEKKSFSAHQKSHINKVMGHATVGYMIWDNLENEGEKISYRTSPLPEF